MCLCVFHYERASIDLINSQISKWLEAYFRLQLTTLYTCKSIYHSPGGPCSPLGPRSPGGPCPPRLPLSPRFFVLVLVLHDSL